MPPLLPLVTSYQAHKMYLNMVQWRAAKNVDELYRASFPERDQVLRLHPHFWHKVDKYGRPVMYDRLGFLDVEGLLQVSYQSS